MKTFFCFLVLLSLASCSTFTGEHSLGKNITLIEGDKDEDKKIFYCPDKTKPCSEGMRVIPAVDNEYVDDSRSNDQWIIARTVNISSKKESYWIINKDFALGDKDCGKEDCGNYIKTFISGPLTLEDFNGHRKELRITLEMPKKK
ncbi:MAG: hypothetical protein WDO14_12125 [Bacteroidota bacterium]